MRPCPALCCSSLRSVQHSETDLLPAFAVEILRRQPALEIGFARRPFAIEHREPGHIPVSPVFVDHALTKSSLVNETVTPRGPLGGRIERIAFPFVTPIAELENVTRQQVLSFGAERGPLQRRRIEHMPNLDD